MFYRHGVNNLEVDNQNNLPNQGLEINFFYLLMRDTQREAETQAEGEAGSTQGAQRGT